MDMLLFEMGLHHVASFSFWSFVIVSLIVKYTWIRPWLEKHCKKLDIEQRRYKQRQLRQVLQDPFLVMGLERRFLLAHEGDQQAALQAMERLRDVANCEIVGSIMSTRDQSGRTIPSGEAKGGERKLAAKYMLQASIVLAVATFVLLPMFPHTMYTTATSVTSLRVTGASLPGGFIELNEHAPISVSLGTAVNAGNPDFHDRQHRTQQQQQKRQDQHYQQKRRLMSSTSRFKTVNEPFHQEENWFTPVIRALIFWMIQILDSYFTLLGLSQRTRRKVGTHDKNSNKKESSNFPSPLEESVIGRDEEESIQQAQQVHT